MHGCWAEVEQGTGNGRQSQKLVAAADRSGKAPQGTVGSHSLDKGDLCEKRPNCKGSCWGYLGEWNLLEQGQQCSSAEIAQVTVLKISSLGMPGSKTDTKGKNSSYGGLLVCKES